LRLLLDTNALLWALTAPEHLSKTAGDAIRDPANEVFASAVNAWEIGVKRAKGRLKGELDLEPTLAQHGFGVLPVTMAHALAIESLPPQHHDPFDRMLVAQAQVESLVLVTSDRKMSNYAIAVLPAR
jgi:PIN domain nuclease of toxin-antitoxin system